MADDTAEENILDYEDEENETAVDGAAGDLQQTKKDVKGTYVSIHSSGFRDFLLKPELLRAIIDCGFEHPSEGVLKMVKFKRLRGGKGSLGKTYKKKAALGYCALLLEAGVAIESFVNRWSSHFTQWCLGFT